MLKLGLIGCGGMGKTHSAAYEKLKEIFDINVVAVADLERSKAEEVAQKFPGAKIYETGEELIANEKLDSVDICLPTYLHTIHAVKAMEAGMNVFLEKPVCLNDDEAKMLLDAKKKSGVNIQIGQVIRFWDEYVWLKNAVSENKYGKVISGVFQRVSAAPWSDWYFDAEKSGTVALDLHIHDADFILHLMGQPKNVESSAARDKNGVIQQIFTKYTYDDAVITAEGCWDYPDHFPFNMSFRVKMEKATAVYDGESLTVYVNDGSILKPISLEAANEDNGAGINVSSLGGYYNELYYYVERLTKNEKSENATLEQAIEAMQMINREVALCGGRKI